MSSLLPTDIHFEQLDNDSDSETAMESITINQVPVFLNNEGHFTHDSMSSLEHSMVEGHLDLYQMIDTVSQEPLQKHPLMHASPKPVQRMPFTSISQSNLNNVTRDLSNAIGSLNPVTPTKPLDCTDPLTPTANLKMLISVASPEIRIRDKKKELFRQDESSQDSLKVEENAVKAELCSEETDLSNATATADDFDTSSIGASISRKDKSLGLLCQKFLSRFPEYPGPFDNMEICLDEVAKELAVERRRIYDIVNVLESVEMVSRLAKNKYMWHGKNNLAHTLCRLKKLGELEGMREWIRKIKEYEESRALELYDDKNGENNENLPDFHELKKASEAPITGDPTLARNNLRKDKSLGIMSQKFLMLFLVSEPKVVNLDISAKILIGDPNVDRTESSKFKTKIRRLYDIANILTSLNLIKKVHVTEVRGRKPAFKYVGPDVDNDVEEVHTMCTGDGSHRPSSKHSLLDCIKNPQVCSMLTAHKTCFPSNSKKSLLSSAPCASERKNRVANLKTQGKKPISRHASFEQICQVAEEEHSKLCSKTSKDVQPRKAALQKARSDPSSLKPLQPALFSNQSMQQSTMSQSLTTNQIVKQQSKLAQQATNDGSIRHIVVIQGDKQVHYIQAVDQSEPANLQNIKLTHVGPNAGSPQVISGPPPQTSLGMPAPPTPVLSPTETPPAGSNPNFVHLTPEQIEAVLLSIGSPSAGSTPLASDSNKLVDAATQFSPPPRKKMPSVVQRSAEEEAAAANTRRSKRSVQNQYELPSKIARCDSGPVDMGSQSIQTTNLAAQGGKEASSSQDAEVESINQPALLRAKQVSKPKPSPLRALHLEPEFRSTPSPTSLAALAHSSPSPDIVSKPLATATKDCDLASPLPLEMKQGRESVASHTMHLSNTSSPVMFLSRPSSLGSAGELDAQLDSVNNMLTNRHQEVVIPTSITTSPQFVTQQDLVPGVQYHIFQTVPQQGNSVATKVSPSVGSSRAITFMSPQGPRQLLTNKASPPELNVFAPSINQVPLAMISPPQSKLPSSHNTRSVPVSHFSQVFSSQGLGSIHSVSSIPTVSVTSSSGFDVNGKPLTPCSTSLPINLQSQVTVTPIQKLMFPDYHTPQGRMVSVVQPGYTMTSLDNSTSSASIQTLATPNTFFRSTPGFMPVVSTSQTTMTPRQSSSPGNQNPQVQTSFDNMAAVRRLTMSEIQQGN